MYVCDKIHARLLTDYGLKINVIGGELEKCEWNIAEAENFYFMIRSYGFLGLKSETLLIKNPPDETVKARCHGCITRLEQLDQESAKSLAGTAAWGAVGYALLGPLGAIGGWKTIAAAIF